MAHDFVIEVALFKLANTPVEKVQFLDTKRPGKVDIDDLDNIIETV
ncbi:hypothetical protein ABES02_26290 [Neobacillus pocheonensis]|nr:hypothetical protein [Bacillus sp. AFS031507]